MTYNFANDRFTNYREEAQPKRHHAVAIFILHGNHEVVVRRSDDGLTATCDTCSLSQTAARAAVFAYENGIRKMTFDGADPKRN